MKRSLTGLNISAVAAISGHRSNRSDGNEHGADDDSDGHVVIRYMHGIVVCWYAHVICLGSTPTSSLCYPLSFTLASASAKPLT